MYGVFVYSPSNSGCDGNEGGLVFHPLFCIVSISESYLISLCVRAWSGNMSWQYVHLMNWIVSVGEGEMGVCIWFGYVALCCFPSAQPWQMWGSLLWGRIVKSLKLLCSLMCLITCIFTWPILLCHRASSLWQALVTVRTVDVVCPVGVTDKIKIGSTCLIVNLQSVPIWVPSITFDPFPRSLYSAHLSPRVWKDQPALEARPIEKRFHRKSGMKRTFCRRPFFSIPSMVRVIFISPIPLTQRSRSSATATDHVPDGIDLKLKNHSLCSIMCYVAPELANQTYLSRFTLSAWDHLLMVMKA